MVALRVMEPEPQPVAWGRCPRRHCRGTLFPTPVTYSNGDGVEPPQRELVCSQCSRTWQEDDGASE